MNTGTIGHGNVIPLSLYTMTLLYFLVFSLFVAWHAKAMDKASLLVIILGSIDDDKVQIVHYCSCLIQ